jgi:hypothetical protein
MHALALALAPQTLQTAPARDPASAAPSTATAPAPRVLGDWYPSGPRPPFVTPAAASLGDDPSLVHLPNARLVAGEEPLLPAALVKPLESPFGGHLEPGWFLAHFRSSPTKAEKAWLDQRFGAVLGRGGDPKARWYLPNRTLAVYVADWAGLYELTARESVDAVQRYQPAYKLDPSIGSLALTTPERAADPALRLNLDLVPGHPVATVEAELAALGVEVVGAIDRRTATPYDVSFLVVRALPSQLVSIAWIEGVRNVQESYDGARLYDLSAGGKIQAHVLAADDKAASPIATAANFPLWITHGLRGQGQMIGVVDTNLDWNNTVTALSPCDGVGFPDDAISNYGFATPVAPLLGSIGSGGVSLKIPRADLLDGAAVNQTAAIACTDNAAAVPHGSAVAGAAAADFYGSDATAVWEHDPDDWDTPGGVNISGLLGNGLAHEAQLYFTPVFDDQACFAWATDFEDNMAATLANMSAAGCAASVHSTGVVEAQNVYTALSVVHDVAGYAHDHMLQCIAAGNDGDVVDALSSQAVVKNALTVGASDDVLKPEDRAGFSSVGPRFDGALKPDLLVPGCDTFPRALGIASLLVLPSTNGASTESCALQYTCGTSFSAPIAAGAAALLHQYVEEGNLPGHTDPSAALLKALLIHGSQRLTGALLGSGEYPSEYQGWGEPDLRSVTFPLVGSLLAYDAPGGGMTPFADAGDPAWVLSFDGTPVPAGAAPVRVTLAWTDEPGSSGGGKKLVNDLDLVVRAPDGSEYLGSDFDTALGQSKTGGSANTLDNVECAIVPFAVGTWVVVVRPGDGNYADPQGFALVVSSPLAGSPSAFHPATVAGAVGTSTGGNAATDLGDGTIERTVWGGFRLTASASEAVDFDGASMTANLPDVDLLGAVRLWHDVDEDGLVTDGVDAELAGAAVAGTAIAFSSVGVQIPASTSRAFLVTLGDDPAPAPATGAITLRGALALGAAAALVLAARRRRRAATALAAIVLATGLTAIGCGGGGGGGGSGTNYKLTFVPANAVLTGALSGETITATGSTQKFNLAVLPLP